MEKKKAYSQVKKLTKGNNEDGGLKEEIFLKKVSNE